MAQTAKMVRFFTKKFVLMATIQHRDEVSVKPGPKSKGQRPPALA